MDSLAEELLHHIASEASRIQHQFQRPLTPEQLFLQMKRSDVAEEIEDLCKKVQAINHPADDKPYTSEEIRIRPTALECDVVRFQNNKDKWIAFVGLKDGRPYEIFTGLADDEYGIMLPKSVTHGKSFEPSMMMVHIDMIFSLLTRVVSRRLSRVCRIVLIAFSGITPS